MEHLVEDRESVLAGSALPLERDLYLGSLQEHRGIQSTRQFLEDLGPGCLPRMRPGCSMTS